MTPEQRARQQIDLLLQQCGWIVQSRAETNLAAGPGVAIREARLKTGEADYLLFAGGKAHATAEVKPEGYTLPVLKGSLASTPPVWILSPLERFRPNFATTASVLRPVFRNIKK
jgi:hypothetical protein